MSDRVGDQSGYRSRLSRLMMDETKCGGVVHDRFLREEVATGGGQGGGDDCTTAIEKVSE